MKPTKVPFNTNANLTTMNKRDVEAWMKRAADLNKPECVQRARMEIEARYAADSESYFEGHEPEGFRIRILRMIAGCREFHPLGVAYLRKGLQVQKAIPFVVDMVRGEATGGFYRMIECERTDDTAEAIALDFPDLLDGAVRAIARDRLVEHDPAWSKRRGLLSPGKGKND